MSNENHFEVYPQRSAPEEGQEKGTPNGQYGWRFRSANGQITASSGEGYNDRHGANRAIHGFIGAVTGADPHPPIIDVDD